MWVVIFVVELNFWCRCLDILSRRRLRSVQLFVICRVCTSSLTCLPSWFVACLLILSVGHFVVATSFSWFRLLLRLPHHGASLKHPPVLVVALLTTTGAPQGFLCALHGSLPGCAAGTQQQPKKTITSEWFKAFQ